MKKRLVLNDIKQNKLLSFSTWMFMAISAILFALTCFLFSGLTGSVSLLMEQAHAPDMLQMHTGEVDEASLERFTRDSQNAEQYQLLGFLNLDSARFLLNGHDLTDSGQDNGVSIQSRKFDYLVDMENKIITPKRGELYVPVCYRSKYDLEVGQAASICGMKFTIAGFLRDPQMSSMMSSSKRFLVSPEDYQTLLPLGSEEYLIEFTVGEGGSVNALADEYAAAGMPSNGPSITRSQILLMSCLSDGITAIIILLVSVIMLLISILCIRFTLLAKLEADRSEIGMLKAVGISRRDIRSIYFVKYAALSAAGAVAGLIAAYFIKAPLQAGMREVYGASKNSLMSVLVPILGTAATECMILLSVRRILKRTERLSAVEALTGRGDGSGKKLFSPQYLLVTSVIAAGVFLMTVPQNLSSTLSSPEMVTYMGVGGGDVIVDIGQTDDISQKTQLVSNILAEDGDTSQYTVLLTKTYRGLLPDSTYTRLNVVLGDHRTFPVSYAYGRAPVGSDEIALSYLSAQDFEASVGDSISLTVNGSVRSFKVCGIYSDITAGGKTAKATFTDENTPTAWSSIYVKLRDGTSVDEWVSDCESRLASIGVAAKVMDIKSKTDSVYGDTVSQIKMASWLAIIISAAVIMTVVLLFAHLLVTSERNDISLKKALGLTASEIRAQYLIKYFAMTCVGILLGILAGNVLGEAIVGVALKMFGAVGFKFIINGVAVCLVIPLVALASAAAAVFPGLGGIKKIKAYECCTGRE